MKTIGTAIIEYNEQGNVTSATFIPDAQKMDESLLAQLKRIKQPKDSQELLENANMVLAGYFQYMNDIELSDKFENEIAIEDTVCEKFESGAVKKCTFRFVFKAI